MNINPTVYLNPTIYLKHCGETRSEEYEFFHPITGKQIRTTLPFRILGRREHEPVSAIMMMHGRLIFRRNIVALIALPQPFSTAVTSSHTTLSLDRPLHFISPYIANNATMSADEKAAIAGMNIDHIWRLSDMDYRRDADLYISPYTLATPNEDMVQPLLEWINHIQKGVSTSTPSIRNTSD